MGTVLRQVGPVMLSSEAFEALVVEALASLPDQILGYLRNVAVTVERWPTRQQLARSGLGPGYTLFGLYEGIPLTRRDSGYNLVPPDRITIFQGPIEQTFNAPEAICQQVRKTVIHELAHHFGFDEDEIRELGYG